MSVQIEVERLRVRSLDVDFHEISWRLASTTEDIFDYTFQVLRSEAPEGPFEPISEVFEDQYLFIDNQVRRGHSYRQLHYKILVTQKSTGDTKEFGPASQGPEADLVATELRKHMNILFREFIGRRCWVFPVRTFGQRCSECWNDTLQKRTKSGCLSCYDTGFVKGYHRPVEAWISIDPNPSSEQNTSVGPLQQSTTTARMGYWPPVKPRDIIIEAENNRWRVNTISTTQQVRAAVHQELGLHQIPKTDVEYRIEFDIGGALKDLWMGPARNFTNPHDLEGFKDEEIPDIFSLYPTTYPRTQT
jgi:hypothetical protein